jgi:hypothetical protein
MRSLFLGEFWAVPVLEDASRSRRLSGTPCFYGSHDLLEVACGFVEPGSATTNSPQVAAFVLWNCL